MILYVDEIGEKHQKTHTTFNGTTLHFGWEMRYFADIESNMKNESWKRMFSHLLTRVNKMTLLSNWTFSIFTFRMIIHKYILFIWMDSGFTFLSEFIWAVSRCVFDGMSDWNSHEPWVLEFKPYKMKTLPGLDFDWMLYAPRSTLLNLHIFIWKKFRHTVNAVLLDSIDSLVVVS